MRARALSFAVASSLLASIAAASCGTSRDIDLFPPSQGGSDGSGGSSSSSMTGAGGDGGSGGVSCPPDAPPLPPAITSPEPNRIDILPDTLVISSSPFSDPDKGDEHGATELEIWTVNNGNLDERVWRAQLTDKTNLTTANLKLGTLQGSALTDGGLAEWTDYAVRARYLDDHGACSQASAWSAPVHFRTDDGSTYLYDPTVIREVRLFIPKASWDAIDAEAIPPGCVPYKRNYYTGSLTIDGQVYDGVGIHVKGGCGSARNLGGKAGFKVNLEWDDPSVPGCPPSRKIFGQKGLTLNNGVQDHSFTHERLGYMLYKEMGIATPRAAHVHLFVNNEDWGVYLNVEGISRRFLSRWFGSNKGMLYEGTYWCDILPQNMPVGTDDSGCFTREFEPSACSPQDPAGDVEDYELARQLAQKIQALPVGKFYPAIEEFFNFDTFLSQWAIESMTSHWDAYEFSIINNYRVYHDPSTDKWQIIPTGIDQTFGSNQDPWAVSAVLAARCVSEPTCNAAFAARLKKVSTIFQTFDLATKAQTIHDQIAPGIQADPRKEYSFNEFNNAHQATLSYFIQRPPQIQSYLASHGF